MQASYSSDRGTKRPASRIEIKERLVRELAGSNYMAAEELRVLLKVRREINSAR